MPQYPPAHPAEFTPIAAPDGCGDCFFAQGIVAATNAAANELRANGAMSETRYQQLRAIYAGGCALRDNIGQNCKGTSTIFVESEPMMKLCDYLHRQPRIRDVLADKQDVSDRLERPLQPEL